MNQKILKAAETTHSHLKIVHEISDLINRSSGLDKILDSVVRKISESLDYDVVSIYIWDETRCELRLRSTVGLNVDLEHPVHMRPDEGLTGLVFKTVRPQVVMPASTHPNYKYFPEIGEEEYESYIGVPIVLNNRCIGVLVGQITDRRRINPAEETLFQIIASRLAGLLEVADTLERLRSGSPEHSRTRTYQGIGMSPGLAVGEVFLLRGLFQQIKTDKRSGISIENEKEKLLAAFSKVEHDLHDLIQSLDRENILSQSEIDIFEAHLMILKSSSLQETLLKKLEEGEMTAERAIIEGIESIATQFDSLSERYLREKAQDFRDIGERLLHEIVDTEDTAVTTNNDSESIVVVAKEIGPSFISLMSRKNIAAIITEKGGVTSHVVIIAKSLKIPMVVGIEKITDLVSPGERIIVDGHTGFIFINPEKELIEEYESTSRKIIEFEKLFETGPADLPENCPKINITANIGLPIDIELSKHYGIENVGLLRTEFSFTCFSDWPGVREQVKMYKDISSHFSGYVTIRTLDIGADKILPYHNLPEEENPLLGMRAIRFSMENLGFFKDQIKAVLLAVRKGCRLRILLPMVTNLWEVETTRQIIEELSNEVGLQKSDIPRLGIMLEVPALVYQLEELRGLVDFISVGTNDLIQYLLAVDRNSNVVGHLYSSYHPAVIRMLDEIFIYSESVVDEVSVCGEMAGIPPGAVILLALGYRNLSVAPSRAPVIRYLGRNLDLDRLQNLRSELLIRKKDSDIKRLVYDVVDSLNPVLSAIE